MNLIPIQKTLTNSKIRFWLLGHEMIENDPLIRISLPFQRSTNIERVITKSASGEFKSKT